MDGVRQIRILKREFGDTFGDQFVILRVTAPPKTSLERVAVGAPNTYPTLIFFNNGWDEKIHELSCAQNANLMTRFERIYSHSQCATLYAKCAMHLI
jgi:hypothetical protein